MAVSKAIGKNRTGNLKKLQNFTFHRVEPLSVQQRKVSHLAPGPDMEVKLSISSSRRISFASDFKDFDLEVEELEKQRDNPSYRRGTVTYLNSDSDDDDDVESNYVNSIWNNCNVEQADKVHSEQS